MSSEETLDRLEERARSIGLEIPIALAASLVDYYELLARWNRTINLTSLADPDAAIDRLLLEPVLAAHHLPRHPALLDLGSGGGSPAIPLALALDARALVMVESRGRKAAFLREAARQTELNAVVEAARFEDVAARAVYRESMDLVSIRAVRMDAETLTVAAQFVRPGGRLALLTSTGQELPSLPVRLRLERTIPLIGRALLAELLAT